MPAGEASFSVAAVKLNNRSVFHFYTVGGTYTKYDWFYKVRDKFESYADTASLSPLRFIRDVQEGRTRIYEDYVFNHQRNKVYSSSINNKNPARIDSVNISACTTDLVTAIYHSRSLDFSKYKLRDTIPITFVLDGKVFPTYLRYLGKEVIYDENLGKVRCIKFSPKLLAGTIFKGGEGMTVWITDDENKIPVRVETPIVIGSIKVFLIKHSGLRNKMDCLVK